MERSPIDIDALARMANELFRDGSVDGGAPAPGPTAIPSAAQVAPAAAETGLGAGSGHLPNVPTGGATFSPSAPPARPGFGRAVSAEAPVVGYGTGQPRFGTAPAPDSGAAPLGFDPRAIPGFGPIPHVEDGFDADALLRQAGSPQSFGGLPSTNGVASFGGIPQPGPIDVPSAFQAARGFDPSAPPPFGAPAGGTAFSPSDPPARPASGRLISAEAPIIGYGYGNGQPRLATASAPGSAQPPGFDRRDYIDPTALADIFGSNTSGTKASGTQAFGFDTPSFEGFGANVLPQSLHGLDPATLGKLASPYLAPASQPGGTAAPGAAYPGAEASPNPPAGGTRSRNNDRPTPNAFAFTDEPHLGEFAEQSILRASLDPQHGAPAIEGLRDRATPLADPYSESGRLVPSTAPSFYFLDDRMDYFADDVPHVPRPTATPFNAEAVRRDFPVLHQTVNGHPLVWLDNGATTQKPQSVIDSVSRFYERDNSNISRSAHELAARATNAYEDARKTVQRFINASEFEEIVFVRGTTEAINLVAQSFGRRFIKAGDEILLTHAEHHANIVPWYNLAKEVGAHLKVVPFDDNGEIMLDEYEQLLNHRVKIVATTHVANALGTILPVKAMTEMAHRHGIPVLVDGAQSISHMPIDVQDIDCDFYVFSGHKVFAPTGIGALYGKKALLDQMPPWQGGGNMIKDVTFEKITFQPAPFRFEAGTGNIADAIGLAEALKYIERLGMTNIEQYEHALLDYATQKLAPIKGLTIIGKAREKAGVISFLLEGKEPAEVGKALNEKGIAVRAGHHCALPILRRYGAEATVRPAFAMYNTYEDADRLADAVREIATN